MTNTKKTETKGPTVQVDGAISDGKGGFLAKGSKLPADADVASLKEKGLI